jgi:hypothetical protein
VNVALEQALYAILSRSAWRRAARSNGFNPLITIGGSVMFKGRALTSLAILGLLMLSLAGCGGKLRMTGKKMCESEGGAYNVQMKHCTYSNQPRSAKESCQAKGGYYDEAADVCEIGVD